MENYNFKITEWLDNQVEYTKKLSEDVEFKDDDVEIHNLGMPKGKDEVHLSVKALRFIATKLKLELYVGSRRKYDKENPYEVFFIYKGIKFLDIETEEEYQEYGAII